MSKGSRTAKFREGITLESEVGKWVLSCIMGPYMYCQNQPLTHIPKLAKIKKRMIFFHKQIAQTRLF